MPPLIYRSSTPKTEETDAAFAEKKRAKEHFLFLISSLILTAERLSNTMSITASSPGLTMCSPVNILFNRMTAENARKKAYANIYSGPISNRGSASVHFQH